MKKNKRLKPAISIDFKRFLIRIHKDTLHIIEDPDCILLMVNPNEHTLAILPGNCSDPNAHHISKRALVNEKSFELYSTSLVQNLQSLYCNWENCKTYRIYGEKIPDKTVIRFNIAEAISIN